MGSFSSVRLGASRERTAPRFAVVPDEISPVHSARLYRRPPRRAALGGCTACRNRRRRARRFPIAWYRLGNQFVLLPPIRLGASISCWKSAWPLDAASAALSRTMYSFGDTQLPESRLPQSHLPETGLPTIYAFADETCRGVAETMATSGVSAMPVVDRSTKALCGHVTVQDLLAGRRRSVQREQGRVRVFGSAALTYKKRGFPNGHSYL